jgi:hypothetical protein
LVATIEKFKCKLATLRKKADNLISVSACNGSEPRRKNHSSALLEQVEFFPEEQTVASKLIPAIITVIIEF